VWDELREDIEFQLAELRDLCERSASELSQSVQPAGDFVAALAAGAALHAFYCGIENSLKRIEVLTGGALPRGESWHIELLEAAGADTGARPWVLGDDLRERIATYLRFRHAFRNVYPQHLEWARLAPLLQGMGETLERFECQLREFLVRLETWPRPS